jgi:HEAT repeat protein
MPQIDTDQPRAGDDRESPRSELRVHCDVSATARMAVYQHRMNAVDDAPNAEVDRCVAELAVPLVDRLPDAVSLIETSVREEIPEMIPETRDEAQIALLDDAIQGNVETILYALRHNSGLEDVRHRSGVAVPIPFATS